MPMEYYLLVAGVVLLLVELAVPGFGIFGVAGMVCLTGGGYYLLGGGQVALAVLVTFYLLLAMVIAFLCFYLPSESKWNPFVLWNKQRNTDGYTGGKDFTALQGKTARALTTLRTAGTIIVDGERIDAVSTGDFIDKDSAVRIVRVEGSKVFVEREI